jgi:trimeric autotransporter adhesin
MRTTNKIISLVLCCLAIMISQKAYSQCTNCPSSTTDGWSSNALGHSNTASGPGSAAIGFRNETLAIGSIAIGKDLHIPSHYGYNIVIGSGYDEGENYRLSNNVANSLMIGLRSNVHTFLVTPAPSNGKTGKIGIGSVINPQAKLHIRADEAEHATLRLEATAADKYARIYFGDAHHITAANQQNMKFSLTEDKSFIFENGKVGIGTDTPEAKLHVTGDFQVGNAANPQSIRLYGSINATGEFATTYGDENTASGKYSFIAGRNSHIVSTTDFPSHYSNIIGSWSKIEKGGHANVIGSFSEALNNFSFVIGTWSKAKGSSSFAIGSHVEAWSGGSFIIGNGKDTTKFVNTIPNSLMVGFGSTIPTLFVEKAPFSFDNDRTGRIGIGNVTGPQAKLHIRADAVENATLMLEATGQGKESSILFGSEHYISAAEEDHFNFNTAEGKAFIFRNGDIYMEDINSGIIMKSPNGHCWRGVMTDNGTLTFSQTDCPEEATSVQNLPVQQGNLKAYPNPVSGNLIIESELYGNNTEITINSMDGKMILRQMITSEKTEVNMKRFIPGTYILQLLSNGQAVESRKIVRQ